MWWILHIDTRADLAWYATLVTPRYTEVEAIRSFNTRFEIRAPSFSK